MAWLLTLLVTLGSVLASRQAHAQPVPDPVAAEVDDGVRGAKRDT